MAGLSAAGTDPVDGPRVVPFEQQLARLGAAGA